MHIQGLHWPEKPEIIKEFWLFGKKAGKGKGIFLIGKIKWILKAMKL